MSDSSKSVEIDSKYRYYKCELSPFGDWKCNQVKTVLPPSDNKISQMVLISTYYPNFIDEVILKYALIPKVTVSKG